MPAQKKTSTEELVELIKQIVADKIQGKDPGEYPKRLLLTARKTKAYYKEKLGKDISTPTIRSYGLSNDGILLIRYPKVFSYNNEGKRSTRGMVINVKAFKNTFDLSEYLESDENNG